MPIQASSPAEKSHLRRELLTPRIPLAALSLSFSILLLTTPLAAQDGETPPAVADTASVLGTVFDPARNAPLEGARVFLYGTPYAAITDESGNFRIEAPLSGRYDIVFTHPTVNRLGILPRQSVMLHSEQAVEAHLTVPVAPRVAALRQHCPAPADGGIVSGVVRDPETGVPLPGVRIILTWADAAGDEVSAVVTTGRDGRYLACGLPTGRRIHARARFLGEVGDVAISFTIDPRGYAERDLGLRPEPAGPAGSLAGVLRDWTSNEPVRGAIVRLPATGREALSDERGRFRFEEVPQGTHDLEIQHLAYGTRTQQVEVRGARDPELEIRVPTEAIAIEGFEIVGRSEAAEHRRRTGTRVDLMTRSDIEERAPVSQHVGHLIQGRFPGVTVRMILMPDPEDPVPLGDDRLSEELRLCIQTHRMAMTPATVSTPCAAVIVDGVRIHDPGIYIQDLPPDEIESIEFIPPARAGFRYGTGVGNRGVLEIWTRGNGPYAERPR